MEQPVRKRAGRLKSLAGLGEPMETVWFGIKLAFGLAIGFAIVFFLFREIRGFLFTLQFTRAGCTYQKGVKPGTPSGWLTRDIKVNDYLLWDDARSVCLRMTDASELHRWDKQQWEAWAARRGGLLIPLLANVSEKTLLNGTSQMNP
jgi:hypothetical protein